MENFIIVNKGIKHLRVRLEGDLRTGFVGIAYDGHLLGDDTPGKLHLVNFTVFMHPDLHPLGQGVDYRRTNAVQTAGDLIAAAAEFTTGVQNGKDHLHGRPTGLGLDIHRNTTAIVGNGDGIAGIDGDGDMLTVARQRLIDGIVHNFVHQMVQTRGGGGADIHTGTLADSFQALQNLDLGTAVFLGNLGFFRHSLKLLGAGMLPETAMVINRLSFLGKWKWFFLIL